MSERKNAKIIAFVGMPGSGKSVAAEYFAQKDYPIVHAHSLILSSLDKQGLDPTLENEKNIREQLRNDISGDRVVTDIIEQINHLIDAGQHHIIVDGMGSWLGYKDLHHAFPGSITIVALLAARHVRHHRLTKREHRPMTDIEATTRDYDEVENLGKGGVIALADRFIVNEDSLDNYYAQLASLQQAVEF